MNASNRVIFNRDRLVDGHRRWLDRYNPLRGLDMRRLGSLFEAGTEGDFVELQWLNRLVERRDGTVLALKRRRKAAQRKLEWTVKAVTDLPNGFTEEDAEKQRRYLEECYNRIENLNEALEWLMLSDFRGYAHLEKVVNREGDLVELTRVPQYHFTRDGIYGQWRFHLEPQMGQPLGGEEIDPGRWVVRESEDPSYEVFNTCFVRKSLGKKDWDGFMETYGIPWFFLIMPPGIAPEKEDEYYQVAEEVSSDGRGVLPNGTEVKTADAGLRGQNPFSDYLREQKEEQVLVGTGGLLTMLTAAGSGTLAGSAHLEAWREIVGGEAASVAEIMRREIDLPCLEKGFGEGVERLAYFDLSEPQEKDPDAFVGRVAILSGAGFQVEKKAVEEGAGVKLEDQDAGGRIQDAGGDALEGEEGKEAHEGTKAQREKEKRLKNTRSVGLSASVEALLLAEATLAALLDARRTFLQPVRSEWLSMIERVRARGEEPVTVNEAETLVAGLQRELGELIPEDASGAETALEAVVKALEAGLGSAAVLGLRDRLRERRQVTLEKEDL